MSRSSRTVSTVLCGLFIAPFILASCAPERGEKPFLPYVIQEGNRVRAISEEDAKVLCEASYCEPNQLYSVNFGRKRRKDNPPPQPITEPSPQPTPTPTTPTKQPAESYDYARNILGLDAAWAVTEGSSNIVVGVIDSGIAYTHPDLRDNIWTNEAEKNGRPGVDDDGNGYIDDVYGYDFYNDRPNGFDDNGHGTHVAGTIGAPKNSIGVRGVSPRVKLMPLKFLGASGSGDTADAIRAIDYAIAQGVKILSNSWGGGGYSKLLDQAVQRAVSAGIIFVAAAGNGGYDGIGDDNDVMPNYPSNYPNVLAVGSSDRYDSRSSFSNYGRASVQIFAPGSDIYSTYPGDAYRTMSGTSMATPQVSGALALALSLGRASPDQVLQDLCDSSTKRLTRESVCGRMHVGDFIRRVNQR